MENASKALIMAGGILIGIIILTIGVYIFTSFGNTSQNIQKQVDERITAEFNNNFLKYENMKECTIHDIVSLAGFAKKNNIDFPNINSIYYVSVILKGYNNNKDISTLSEENYMELLKENSIDGNQIQYYTCISIEYNKEIENSRVTKIVFQKN